MRFVRFFLLLALFLYGSWELYQSTDVSVNVIGMQPLNITRREFYWDMGRRMLNIINAKIFQALQKIPPFGKMKSSILLLINGLKKLGPLEIFP